VIAPRLRKLAILADPETRREVRAVMTVARRAVELSKLIGSELDKGEQVCGSEVRLWQAVQRLQPKRARGRG
jgi:hypothetical protein